VCKKLTHLQFFDEVKYFININVIVWKKQEKLPSVVVPQPLTIRFVPEGVLAVGSLAGTT
jgi:hypothetical protein